MHNANNSRIITKDFKEDITKTNNNSKNTEKLTNKESET